MHLDGVLLRGLAVLEHVGHGLRLRHLRLPFLLSLLDLVQLVVEFPCRLRHRALSVGPWPLSTGQGTAFSLLGAVLPHGFVSKDSKELASDRLLIALGGGIVSMLVAMARLSELAAQPLIVRVLPGSSVVNQFEVLFHLVFGGFVLSHLVKHQLLHFMHICIYLGFILCLHLVQNVGKLVTMLLLKLRYQFGLPHSLIELVSPGTLNLVVFLEVKDRRPA